MLHCDNRLSTLLLAGLRLSNIFRDSQGFLLRFDDEPAFAYALVIPKESMANEKSSLRPSLRFDHREIAVIFSLFIFVSLLMFTVGILVATCLPLGKMYG